MQTMSERGWNMKKVQAKRDDLLKALRENLVKHEQDYTEMSVAYQKLAVKSLEERLYALAKNPVADLNFDLSPPTNYAKAYKQAITMLEYEQREVIELDASEFQCLVMDDWSWKASHEHSKLAFERASASRR